MTVTGSISITNLAERHLRLVGVAFLVHAFEGISITNLAERHLRRLSITAREFAFMDISITNLAERHLRLISSIEGLAPVMAL